MWQIWKKLLSSHFMKTITRLFERNGEIRVKMISVPEKIELVERRMGWEVGMWFNYGKYEGIYKQESRHDWQILR